MTDNKTPAQRSANMRSVRPRDTSPELKLRRFLHAMGLRFRLHRKELPGTPDIVLISRRVAIFMHGCFWHGHRCKRGKLPTSNTDFWKTKIAGNVARDRGATRALRRAGWRPVVIWECELKDLPRLETRLRTELVPPKRLGSRRSRKGMQAG